MDSIFGSRKHDDVIDKTRHDTYERHDQGAEDRQLPRRQTHYTPVAWLWVRARQRLCRARLYNTCLRRRDLKCRLLVHRKVKVRWIERFDILRGVEDDAGARGLG